MAASKLLDPTKCIGFSRKNYRIEKRKKERLLPLPVDDITPDFFNKFFNEAGATDYMIEYFEHIKEGKLIFVLTVNNNGD